MEDSLQRLAAMDESDRLTVIDSIIIGIQIAEQVAREEEMRAVQEQQYNRMALNESQRTGFSADQGGSWYFYNQAAKGFGQPEFRMKWGNRSLEDNWRRSNKREVSFGEIEEFAEDTTAAGIEQLKILSEKSREFYLQFIPLSDSMMDISHENSLFPVRLRKVLSFANGKPERFLIQLTNYKDDLNEVSPLIIYHSVGIYSDEMENILAGR